MSGEIKRRRQAAYRKGFADGVASVAITDQPSPGKQTITGETVRGELCELPPPPSTHTVVDLDAEIASVVQSVNEWDDRTSPEDYPDHLLITSEELAKILRNFADTLGGRNDG